MIDPLLPFISYIAGKHPCTTIDTVSYCFSLLGIQALLLRMVSSISIIIYTVKQDTQSFSMSEIIQHLC